MVIHPKRSIQSLQALVDSCYQNMSDDFKHRKTLAVLFEMSSRINDLKSGNLSFTDIDVLIFSDFKNTYISFLESVLGLKEESVQDHQLLEGTIKVLIGLRKKARIDKNFAMSDRSAMT